MKQFFYIIIWLILFIGLLFLLQLGGLANYSIFAPKYENARREVYEQTKSYNDGVIREMQNFMVDYYKCDDSGKKALKSVILHRVADFPEERLPKEVHNFIRELKGM